jgi:hypothetical protein
MRYARAARTDLEQRTDQIATSSVQALREMIAKPNFYEEWDYNPGVAIWTHPLPRFILASGRRNTLAAMLPACGR